MEQQQNKSSYQNDDNFKALCDWYKKYPIALYTGAGVSNSNEEAENPKYGLGGWEKFLENMLIMHEGGKTQTVMEFRQVVQEDYKPWELADWIVKKVEEDTLKELIVQYIQRPNHFPDRQNKETNNNSKPKRKKKEYKQLGRRFLSHAPTLNSISAFCNQLAAYVEDAQKHTYRILPNPRVRAVLTSNYDPFLEAASSTMFQKHRLKPVGRFGSSAGDLRQTPVYHIHGYVPYPEKKKDLSSLEIPAMVDPVLTSADYENAWYEKDVFNFTMGSQIQVLRNYSVLFVGFSFRDKRVNDLLIKLNKNQEEREKSGKARLYHYALMKESQISKKGKSFFVYLGIKPIGLDDYSQVPEFFKNLYIRALNADYGTKDIPLPWLEKKHGKSKDKEEKDNEALDSKEESPQMTFLSADKYWEHLYKCRNRTVGTRKKHK
jgi:hypothetical protein